MSAGQQTALTSSRCTYEIVGYRLGRNVAESRTCKRQTTHPSGRCYQHRSDTDEDYDR